jgi:streptogramin lyase
LEPLEDRTLLDINFATMASLLNRDLNNLTSTLSSQFSTADPIPLVGNQLSNVDVLSGPFNTLTNELSQIGVSQNPDGDIKAKLGSGASATFDPGSQSAVEVTIPLSPAPGSPQSLSFDLQALKNFLVVNSSSSQNFQVSEGFSYTLKFHYDESARSLFLTGGPMTLNVSAQSAGPNQNQLLTFTGTLNANPDSKHASLYAQGTDNKGNTKLIASLAIGVGPDGSVGTVNNDGTLNDIVLTNGSYATVDTILDLSFGDPGKGLPFNLTPHADLVVTWSFSGQSIITTSRDQLGQVTTAQFQNVSLPATNLAGGPNVDGFAGTGVVDSAIQRIRNFVAPFQPVASFLNTELPGLDAIGLHVTLAEIFGLGSLVSLIDVASSLPSATGSGQIQYGTLTLASDPQTALANLRSGNLAPGAARNDVFEQADADTNQLFTDLKKLNIPDGTLSSSIDFPLIDDSSSTLFDVLEGRISPLFNFQIHFNYSKEFDLPPIPVGFVPVVPSFTLTFGMDLSLGYDTTGLKTASTESNSSNYAADLLDGFFLTVGPGQTDLSLTVGFSMDADAILAEVGGSIIGSISLTLNPDPGTNIKRLDTDLIREIKDDPLCDLELDGSLSLMFHIKAGFYVPPINVTAFEIDIGPFTLIDFHANCGVGSPAVFPTIPVVDNSTPGNHTILIHNYLASDPNNPGGQISGVEVEDNGMVQRYATTQIAPDGTKTNIGQTIQQMVIYPELLGADTPSTGDDTVIMGNFGADAVNFGTTVIGGDSGRDYVNVLMVGSDTGNDTFEYYGNAQAILIGGKKANTLVGGQTEFGGGLPYGFLQDVKSGNYSDFPGGWVQNIGFQPLGFDSKLNPVFGNPITLSPQLDSGDGPDSLTGTPTADVLYGGSSSNVFIGEGGGDLIRGDEGDPYAGSGGIQNTFLESALLGYPTVDAGRDISVDQIFGSALSNSTNYLQFTGFIDGSYTDNISLQKQIFLDPRPVGVDVSDTLPDGSKKDVQASGITQVLIDAGTGSVSVGDLSPTLVTETDINYEILPISPIAPQNTLTVNTDIGSNDLPHQWTIEEDSNTGGIGGIRLHSGPEGQPGDEGDLVIQHLINNFHKVGGFYIGSIGQLVLDDTTRLNAGVGVGATFNFLSLPVIGPALTINLGGGAETVKVPKMENSFGTGVTVNGGSAANGGVAYDTLSLGSGDFDWDIEPSSVSIGQTSGSPTVNTVFYSGMNELDIETFSDINVEIGQNIHTLDGLPGVISLVAPDNLPSFESLFIDDQNTTETASWTVSQSEIDRTTSSTISIHFVPSHFGQANFVHIDGGVGGSSFDLTPPGVEQGTGENLDGLRGMILTITGHGSDDSIIADDKNTLPYSDVMTPGATDWTVDGSHVSRSYVSDAVQDTTVAGFDYFNIHELDLIGSTRLDSQGRPVANTYKLSPVNETLQELPPAVVVSNATNVLINDQNDTSSFNEWTVTGGYALLNETIQGPPNPQGRDIFYDARNVTINGNNLRNYFTVTPAYQAIFGPVVDHLPSVLKINGGTDNNDTLTIDDSNDQQPAFWTITGNTVLRNYNNPSIDPPAQILYSQMAALELRGSDSFGEDFNIKGTATGATTTISGSLAGENKFFIGDSSFIQGPLILHGNGTGNVLDRGPDIREFPFGGALSSALATVSTGPDEGVWFSEQNASQLGRITTLGQITEVPASPADSPNDVVTGPDGNLYFVNRSTSQLLRLDLPSHNVEVLTPFGLGTIGNLVAGNQNDVWFTLSNGSYAIGELDTVSGNIQLFQAQRSEAPFPLTVLPNGNLVFVYTNSLLTSDYLATITPAGQEIDNPIQSQFGKVGQIVSMVEDARGNLWATADVPKQTSRLGDKPAHGKLLEITTSGVVTQAVDLLAVEGPVEGLNDIAKPGQMVLGSDGALWFTDSLTTVDPVDGNFTDGQIGRFDPSSGFVEELALPSRVIGDPTQNFAILPGPDGNIWFTEPYSSQIGEIIIPKQTALWQITGPDQGQLYSNVTFNSIQNLNGGLGGDSFAFQAFSSLSGKLTGGFPTATLDESQSTGVQVNSDGANSGTLHGQKGTATNIGGGFDNIDSIVNPSASPDLKFDDTSNTLPTTWTLTSTSVTRQVQGQPAWSITLPVNLTSLEIDGGSGGNTFEILDTPTGVTTTVNSGAGNDFVNVIGNSSYPNLLYIDGVGGNDVVTIGSSTADAASFGSAEGGHATSSPNGGGTLANINGTVIIHNTGGQTALIVDESGVTAPVRTIGMSLASQDLDVLGPATGIGGIYFNRTGQVQSFTYFGPQVGSSYIIYSTNGIPNTYLNLGPGNDMVDILATLGPLAINGGGGNDSVTIGGQLPDHGGGVSEIGPSVVLSNPTGTMALTVDDSNVSPTLDGMPNPTSRTAVITATSITGMPAGTTIDYTNANLTSLTILGGAFGNVFGVKNTPAGASTTLDSGNGVDTVYVEATTGPLTVNTQQGGTSPGFHGFEGVLVGSPAGTPGTLDDIQGPLTINTLGRPGVDYASVAFFDAATTVPETYTITNNTIFRSGAAPIYYRVTNELEFRLGSGGNIVNIQGTFPGLPDLFVGGLGNDTFNVGDSANTLNGIQSHLFFQIANPGSQVILHDEGDAGNLNYTLAHDPAISPYNFVQRSNSPYYIVYSGPLKTLQLNAGAGNDSFNVRTLPPTSTTAVLDGGASTNTLQGPNQNNNWQITAPNAGTLDTNIQFGNIQNLIGGTAKDTFAIRKPLNSRFGGSLSGSINGGGGTDTLDYSGFTGNVTVNMRVSAGNGEPGALATGVAGGISNIANVLGSIGNDLIVGDANSHSFTGGTGRNIIIGGAGSDTITGGGGDNILIGGTTIWDANPVALQAIMNEWTNTTLSFDTRVNALRKGITVGGQTYALNTSTVMKDNFKDFLNSGPGLNWFFVDLDDMIDNGAGPGPNDRVTRV